MYGIEHITNIFKPYLLKMATLPTNIDKV